MRGEATVRKISKELFEHLEECSHCSRARRLAGNEAICDEARKIMFNHPVPPPEGGYVE
jgi:hypothetical protein